MGVRLLLFRVSPGGFDGQLESGEDRIHGESWAGACAHLGPALRAVLGSYPPRQWGPIVNVPCPLHPPPVRVQFPEIVLPLTVPFIKLRTLLVVPLVPLMVIPNVPCTLPLKFPLRVNEPVSDVVSEAKQGAVEVKVNWVTLSVLPLPCVKVVEKL